MTATFTAAADRPLDGHSGVAYVGQSGAIGGSVLDLATEMGLGLTAWASTGNQADVDLVEIAGALVEDDNVDVIMLYAEAIDDGAAYTRLAQVAAASGTSLVVLLSGRSTAGKRAAASHTGSMLGDDIGFVLTSRRHGVVMVDDVDELLAVAASLGSRPRPTGRRLAVVTTSGGAGSLAADHCVSHGLDLPELSSTTQASLSPLIPDFGSLSNPVDVTAQLFNREGSAEALGDVCRLVADDPQIDAVAVVLTMVTGPLGASIATDLVRTAKNLPVPLLVAWLAGLDQTAEGRSIFRDAGVPLFSSVGDLTRAAGLLATTPPASAQIEPAGPATHTHELLLRCAAGAATAEDVLTQLGVRHPRTQLLAAGDDISGAVTGLGGRVAMKISAESLAHKSDIGGVRLEVTPPMAAAAHAELVALATEHRLDGFAGVMVQEMIPPGTEIIIGLLSRSDGFAPVLTVGIGGVRTELYRDVVSDIAPVSGARAEQMLRELRGWPLLDGFRGSPAADLPAVVDAIVAVSHALDGWTGDPLELEINPLIVAEKGHGAYAVDLLVTASAADTRSVATSIEK